MASHPPRASLAQEPAAHPGAGLIEHAVRALRVEAGRAGVALGAGPAGVASADGNTARDAAVAVRPARIARAGVERNAGVLTVNAGPRDILAQSPVALLTGAAARREPVDALIARVAEWEERQ